MHPQLQWYCFFLLPFLVTWWFTVAPESYCCVTVALLGNCWIHYGRYVVL